MNEPQNDHSIENEPHYSKDSFQSDPSEERADHTGEPQSERAEAHQSVWSEPGLSRQLAGGPSSPEPYRQWLEEGGNRIGRFESWRNTFLMALLSAPWAVIGAFYGGGQTTFALLSMVVFGPVVEELMKVGLALYAVETRPFWFRSPAQILVCAFGGGLGFAVIENMIYFNIYLSNPSSLLIFWRWTVCVALHVGCSLIAGLGLIRIWKDVWQRQHPAQIHLAFPYLTTAVVLHGAYNLSMVLLNFTGFHF